MKSFKLISALFCLYLVFSCQKKDWACTCDCDPLSGPSFTGTTTITHSTKSAANTKCGDYGKAAVNGNGSWKCKVN